MNPSPTERQTAALGHLLSIPFPVTGPIVFWLLHRRASRFVCLHAADTLAGGIIQSVLITTALIISFLVSLTQFLQNPQFTWDMVWQMGIKAAVVWITLGLVYVIGVIGSILRARAAYQGEWRGRGFTGRLAERLVDTVAKNPFESRPLKLP